MAVTGNRFQVPANAPSTADQICPLRPRAEPAASGSSRGRILQI
jgi:hypothetical protein